MTKSNLPEIESNSSAAGYERQRLGEVYARALLAYLADSPNAETVLRQFGEFVTGVLAKTPQFQSIMSSPRISADEKIRLIDRALQGRVEEQLLRFFRVVGQKDRLDCLKEMYAAARRQWNESRGVVEVHVTTATPLDSGARSRMETALGQKLGGDVEILARVAPDILGGLRVRIGDQVFDGTVANRLASMGREAIDQAVRNIRSETSRFVTDA